jgi:hypothetical protein
MIDEYYPSMLMQITPSLAVLATGLALALLPNESRAIDLPLVRDAYVWYWGTTTNYGGDQNLRVTGSPSGGSEGPCSTYLVFNKDTLPPNTSSSQVTRAILKLYANTAVTAGSFHIYRVTSSWAEGTLTYGAQPSSVIYQSYITIGAVPAKNFINLDVTSLVKDWLSGTSDFQHGLALVPSSTTDTINLSFDSKESTGTSHPPTLQVELTTKRNAPNGDLTMGQFTTGPQT